MTAVNSRDVSPPRQRRCLREKKGPARTGRDQVGQKDRAAKQMTLLCHTPSRLALTAINIHAFCRRHRIARPQRGGAMLASGGMRGQDVDYSCAPRRALPSPARVRRRRQQERIAQLYDLPNIGGIDDFQAREAGGAEIDPDLSRRPDHVIDASERNDDSVILGVVADAEKRQPFPAI